MDISANDAVEAVFRLPDEMRIELARDLLESVVSRHDPSTIPYLTPEQYAELDRRLAEAKADPSILLSEEEFWQRLEGDRKGDA